jgi:hypothetical protein
MMPTIVLVHPIERAALINGPSVVAAVVTPFGASNSLTNHCQDEGATAGAN